MPLDALTAFATEALDLVRDSLREAKNGLSEDLTPCGQENIDLLLFAASQAPGNQTNNALEGLMTVAHTHMKTSRLDRRLSLAWRRLYTEAALVLTLCDCLLQEPQKDAFWENGIARLDKAIIIAGAPGETRLELITACIALIQQAHLPPVVTQETDSFGANITTGLKQSVPMHAALSIPFPDRPPSMLSFSSTYRHTPFILRGFANDWPAVSRSRWASKFYLHQIAGRGRVIPVEIGRDYRTQDWTQSIINWDSFLDYLFTPPSKEAHQKEIMYHAQHDLFKQFSALRDDILIPDYVYSSLPPPNDYVNYRPPANEEGYIVNAWFGPAGTVSPAHTDPFYNTYIQVAGRKAVWLAPPHVSAEMLPYSSAEQSDAVDRTSGVTDGTADSDASALSNTSRLDVFADPVTCLDAPSDTEVDAAFKKTVVPMAMSATLGAGDVLFFPPGWWHAMRSESTSFSVSIWF